MPSFKPSQIVVALASSLFVMSAAHAADASTKTESSVLSKPVATVNGVAIPQARFDFILKQNMMHSGEQDTPELRKNIKETMINQEVIAQAAVKQGLDKTADFQTMMDLSREQNLVNAYLQNFEATHPISDDQMKQEFDKIKAKMGSEEYKAAHILVKTEDEAKAIIAKLKKNPKSFGKLAEEDSIDPGSKAAGGELGWAPAGNYVKPFADALTGLKKGEVTPAPVQTPFGWHVIKLEDKRAMKVPPFEQVKPQLKQRMEQAQIQKVISDLRAAAKVD